MKTDDKRGAGLVDGNVATTILTKKALSESCVTDSSAANDTKKDFEASGVDWSANLSSLPALVADGQMRRKSEQEVQLRSAESEIIGKERQAIVELRQDDGPSRI